MLGVELTKLAAQWRVRLALLVVVFGPLLVTAVLQAQTGLPTDTLYGRWVQEIGLAVPLVLLGGAGIFAVPLLAALVAGDVLSSEDQHGTWAALLTRSRTRWELLGGKAVAAGVCTVGLLMALAVSAVLSGVLLVGRDDLIGLTGQPIAFGPGLLRVSLAWLSTLPTALAVSAVALLVSAATRSSVAGVVGPVVLAFVLHLASLLAPLGAIRPLLLLPGLTAWHGLLLADVDATAVLQSLAVSAGWVVAALTATVLVLRKRDWAVP